MHSWFLDLEDVHFMKIFLIQTHKSKNCSRSPSSALFKELHGIKGLRGKFSVTLASTWSDPSSGNRVSKPAY